MKRDRFRQAHALVLLWEMYGDAEPEAHAEMLREVEEALERLDPRFALAVEHRFGLGREREAQTYAEIAIWLGVSEVQARKRVLQALSQLREDATVLNWGSRFAGLCL
jgi:DNA-directed RNA polymerase specialized sigma24 family protein